MERKNLTPKRIAEATCPDGKKQAFLWDATVPRLALRVTTGGAKSFVFEGKLNRQTIRWTIGSCTSWTTEAARIEATRLQNLLDRGIDPRELERQEVKKKEAVKVQIEAQRVEKERNQVYTLKALCEAYVELLKERGKERSAQQTESVFKVHVFGLHPGLSEKPAKTITADDMADIIRCPMESGKERTAGILRSYLHAAFGAAMRSRYDVRLPTIFKQFGVVHNPVSIIPAIAVKPGTRSLTKDELKSYLKALGGDLSDQALKLALYAGGQRMRPLLQAKVNDFDRENGILRLWDTKGRRSSAREHLLPLGPIAASIVQKLVDRAEQSKSQLLFFFKEGVKVHFDTPGKRVAKISKELGGESFTLMDLRRTVETMLASLGISKDTRAQILSHGISGVQAVHYDRHDYLKEKREALLKWEDFLQGLLGGKKPGKVIQLRKVK